MAHSTDRSRRRLAPSLALLSLILAFAGCVAQGPPPGEEDESSPEIDQDTGDDPSVPPDIGPVQPNDDGSTPGDVGVEDTATPDVPPSGNDGGRPDVSSDTRDGGTPDGGSPDPGPPFTVETCGQLQPPSGGGLCSVQPGSGDRVLLEADVLSTDHVYEGGSVLINPDPQGGGPGEIQCTGCDCSSAVGGTDPTVVTCADAVVSPGLINPHDHLGWGTNGPRSHDGVRYDHRHDWRVGARDHSSISTPEGDFSRKSVLHGELRHLFGGATSIAGSTRGTTPQGLLRNLDTPQATGGVDASVEYSTFPLGDVGGTLKTSGCDYGRTDSASALRTHEIYLPHIAEGIDEAARNEFTCLSQSGQDVDDLVEANTSVVHGIGMTAGDIRELAREGGTLVWSPRTNISLYGHTAPVATYDFYDVPIALGTDWSISGSRNMLRELACVDKLNSTYYNDHFSDYELWKMATYNGALSMGVADRLGDLDQGYVADLAIFAKGNSDGYRAVLEASDEDVALVMRGGEPLYGRESLVQGLLSSSELNQCASLDVCNTTRRVCVQRDTSGNADGSVDFDELKSAAASDAYPMFSCNDPVDDEPTCTPLRPEGGKGSGFEYQGQSTPDDPDGDGIPSARDNCPQFFNPGRPLDGSEQPADQPDADGDGQGDACDPCPTSERDICSETDWDGDGVPNRRDNCPYDANGPQADGDQDGIGDACDASVTPYDLDTQSVAPGDEVQLDKVVVTAVDEGTPGIFVQVPPDDPRYQGPAKSGTYIYMGSKPLPERGDLVSVRGHFEFFYKLPQISNVVSVEIHSSDHALPDPKVIANPCSLATGGSRMDALLGVLVEIQNVTVQSEPDANGEGEFTVGPSCAQGRLRVDSMMYDKLPEQVEKGDKIESLVAPLHFSFDNSKLAPRGPNDLVLGASLRSLEPGATTIPAGQSSAQPKPTVEVVLARKAKSDVTIQLDYPDPGMLDGPSTLTVPKGQKRAEIPRLDGKTASNSRSDTATLEVTGPSGKTQTLDVLIYSSALTNGISRVTVQPEQALANEDVQVTVQLDFPALGGGETVQLSGEGDLSLPGSSTTVPAGDFETTFQVGTGSSLGRKDLTAETGNSKVVTPVTVLRSKDECLIFSEYIEGGGYRNKAVELFNCGGPNLELDKYGLCLISNNNTTCGSTAGLADVTLEPYTAHAVCKDKSKRSSDDPVPGIRNRCDQAESAVMGFNGNDRIVLFRDKNDDGDFQSSKDTIVDAFGNPNSPASDMPWKDQTYRRCNYDAYTGQQSFAVTDYYEEFSKNDADDYGKAPPAESPGCP